MSKKSVLDAMRVNRPCTEDWDQMTGNDRVRFCSHCSKDVNNISEMTPKQAVRLARASGGNLCIRYKYDPVTKAPIFADRFHQISRRAPVLASGAMAASIAFSTVAYAQGDMKLAPQSGITQLECPDASLIGSNIQPRKVVTYGSISGSVVDPNGAVIPGINLTLTDQSGNGSRTTHSDSYGLYEFQNVPEGIYTIKADGISGFAVKTLTNIEVVDGRHSPVDLTLDVEAVYLSGVTVSVSRVEYIGQLSLAVSTEDTEQVNNLIAAGENVNQREDDKTTPLFVAVENGNKEIIETLLNFGAKVNARNKKKQTPLMQVDEDASSDLVDLLVRFGAKINLVDNEGNTALMLAAKWTSEDVVKALIRAGADVNLTNSEGRTALMYAADNGNLESVRALLLAGAIVNQRDKEGESAWDLTGNTDIEDLLVSFGAEAQTPEDAATPENRTVTELPTETSSPQEAPVD